MSELVWLGLISLLFTAAISALSALARRALRKEQHADGVVKVVRTDVGSDDEAQDEEGQR